MAAYIHTPTQLTRKKRRVISDLYVLSTWLSSLAVLYYMDRVGN